MKKFNLLFFIVFIIFTSYTQKTKSNNSDLIEKKIVSGLKFRLLGPALTSGRIADIAIHKRNKDTWYIAAASGGVWKTTNHGTTFNPIFDNYGSYSIGCISIAPTNQNTIWVGTGENNNQRSVGYGDGIYKSTDGGKSFKNMGLKASEHIGKIIIHPNNENIIWVAAYGPLWSKGGERGVYKSIDGGEKWIKTLEISENTGISEIAIDPNNPNILYATSHQRRRREWTYVGGGPESSIYKSTDGGENWKEINSGLPVGEMGRIGIAISPVNSDYVYAIVEAKYNKSGFFRSTNRGESWSKMSDYSTSGNYYQEIICDPEDVNKVFSMNTWLHHTENGGKSFKKTGEKNKHVDNHCIWIDPNNNNHWIVGCDGGIYETYNNAKDWKYYNNIPITQFYKVATDNSKPFYNIYGGTQDNNSMGGPSASINNTGVLNSDWYITNGGDGFESAIDPKNPNIVYAQAQYGWLVRYDKNSGERTPIQPIPGKGESGYRWNWDAPLLISPHDNKTIYFCSNKVFKSTNRGDDWKTISPDLSQQIDRNKLPVMDQVWSIDAVMKNKSTTIYGNIVAFDESPITKGLLFAGTDDGIIQISNDDGITWNKSESFPNIPKNTRINMITASLHDENVLFATLNNHRSGDFKPYILKSNDKGKTWKSISSNLPENGSAFAIKQDHINPELLFVGTEFGCYFSIDSGNNWTKLSGLPTIPVMDIDIQKRENDLVIATFGRGFYVLDNYSPLRLISKSILNKEAHLFPVKDALLFIPSSPLGLRGVGSQGANMWFAKNPNYGATFTLYLKKIKKTLLSTRKDKEKEQEKNKEPISYPSFDELRAEKNESESELIWIIKNEKGEEIRRIISKPYEGISRISWDLRKETTSPIKINKPKPGRYSSPDVGFFVTPGNYYVEVIYIKDKIQKKIIDSLKFNVIGLNNQTLIANNFEELNVFRSEIAEIKRQINGAGKLMNEVDEKLKLYEYAIKIYPNIDINLLYETSEIDSLIEKSRILLWGDFLKSNYEFEIEPSIYNRIGILEYQLSINTSGVTNTQRKNKKIVEESYLNFRALLDSAIIKLKKIETLLSEHNIPYIKGKDNSWKEE